MPNPTTCDILYISSKRLELISKGRTTKTIRLIDNNKAVEISIRGWDEENSQYGLDQSADFFEIGGLETVSEPELAYIVDNVDYRIEQALDMAAGRGNYSYCEPQPRLKVLVVDLDRSAYPICKRS